MPFRFSRENHTIPERSSRNDGSFNPQSRTYVFTLFFCYGFSFSKGRQRFFIFRDTLIGGFVHNGILLTIHCPDFDMSRWVTARNLLDFNVETTRVGGSVLFFLAVAWGHSREGPPCSFAVSSFCVYLFLAS